MINARGALLFVGATNEPWALDPAIMRPGRFDEKIYVPLPDLTARHKLLELSLRGRPLASEVSMDELCHTPWKAIAARISSTSVRKRAPFRLWNLCVAGWRRDVSMRDFEQVLVRVKPSVSGKELVRYEQFTNGRL